MTTQPEALRLAAVLMTLFPTCEDKERAAAELRRLHEAHDWQYRMAGERLRRIEKLEAQRDALLEALKMIAGTAPCIDNLMSDKDIARAAIKAVEENT